MPTPRIRPELSAQPAEEDGCKFFDVTDPKSGASMRLYDFEWLIAAQMNGARGFDEVADWARSALGLDPSAEALEEFASQLSHFGFFELAVGAAVAVEAPAKVAAAPVVQAPVPVVEAPLAAAPIAAATTPSGSIEIEMTPVPKIAALHEGTFNDEEHTMQSTQTKELIERSRRDFDEPAPTVKKQLGRIEMQKVPASEANRPPKQSREPSGTFKTQQTPTPVVTPTPTPAPTPAATAKPAEQKPAAQTQKPVKQAAKAAPAPAPVTRGQAAASPDEPKRRTTSAIALVAVLLLVGGAAAYFGGFLPIGATEVSVVPATPHDLVRLYDGKGLVERGSSGVLSFGEDGKISEIVAAGTEVKPGTPIATLESYVKVEKELADVRERAAFYERQAQALKSKGQDEAAKKNEAKVAEKQKLQAELELRASKLRILATATGAIAEVLAKAGTEVKAGVEVVKMGSNAPRAEFKVPTADLSKMAVGSEVQLQAMNGGASIPAKISKVDPAGTIVVELTSDTLKPGDEARLIKERVPRIVTLPANALVGKNSVYVAAGGTAHLKQVMIADQTVKEVQVSGGLTPGEQVIVSGLSSLKDGQRINTRK